MDSHQRWPIFVVISLELNLLFLKSGFSSCTVLQMWFMFQKCCSVSYPPRQWYPLPHLSCTNLSIWLFFLFRMVSRIFLKKQSPQGMKMYLERYPEMGFEDIPVENKPRIKSGWVHLSLNFMAIEYKIMYLMLQVKINKAILLIWLATLLYLESTIHVLARIWNFRFNVQLRLNTKREIPYLQAIMY